MFSDTLQLIIKTIASLDLPYRCTLCFLEITSKLLQSYLSNFKFTQNYGLSSFKRTCTLGCHDLKHKVEITVIVTLDFCL